VSDPASAPTSANPAPGSQASQSQAPRSQAPGGKPRKKKRRFGGTHAQIRSALAFYKVSSYVTGVFLLLLCIEMILKYGMKIEEISVGPLNLFTGVLIAHGWLYVVYLLADFRLWQLMRWPFSKFILIALGGVIPFLSFIVESRTHKQVLAELAAHPEAAKRY
jgi:integral membrane protein